MVKRPALSKVGSSRPDFQHALKLSEVRPDGQRSKSVQSFNHDVGGALRGRLPGRTRRARPVEVPASVALPALDGLEPYRTRNGNLSLRPATEADDDGAGPAGDAD